jgi:myosin-15
MFKDLKENYEIQRSVSKTGRFVTMRPITPTVAAKFNDSLNNLLYVMSKCKPWFVRCLKPNNLKKANSFEATVVLEQLCYTGMLETIRIRKTGYPIRYKYDKFVRKFRILFSMRIDLAINFEAQKILVSSFLSNLNLANCKNMFQMGFTKVKYIF